MARSARTFPSRGLDKFVVRLTDGMRERIAAAARANNRTMTAEINVWLERAQIVSTGTSIDLSSISDQLDVFRREFHFEIGRLRELLEAATGPNGQQGAVAPIEARVKAGKKR